MDFRTREIKWFLQSIFRGYSDADLRSLDYFIIRKIRPAFKAYAKMAGKGTCPGFMCFVKGKQIPVEEGCKKWNKTIKEIEESMDLMWSDFNNGDELYNFIEKHGQEKTSNKIDRGMRKFGKYFGNFWT